MNMDIKKTTRNLERNGFTVSFFETAAEAAAYIDNQTDGKIIGFGDSRTIADMGLYSLLSIHNTVYDPYQSENNDEFLQLAAKALTAQVFFTSVNGISETGEMVNIDGTGNRVAGSLFGHEKTYFIAGTNKIEETLEKAVVRARNTAGPRNNLKYDSKTPCVAWFKKTGEYKCFDCRSADRICNTLNIYLKKMNDIDEMEVVLINEEMGF